MTRRTLKRPFRLLLNGVWLEVTDLQDVLRIWRAIATVGREGAAMAAAARQAETHKRKMLKASKQIDRIASKYKEDNSERKD